MMKDDAELCKWLRDNSSGIYRPSAQAANRIEELLVLVSKLDELEAKQTIASLKEKVNTLKQKLKDSHRVSHQEINRIRERLKYSHRHKNGDREAF